MVNEKNCVRQLKKGNQRALEFVVSQYGGAVKNVIGRILYDFPEDIQECMDDVFMEVWNNIDRFDEDKGTLRNWILSIAKYRAINYFKRLSKRYAEENLDKADNKLEYAVYIGETEDELESLIEEFTEGLSDIDKQIIKKRFVEDMDIKSIASDSGLKESSVYSRISRSKAKLRSKMHNTIRSEV